MRARCLLRCDGARRAGRAHAAVRQQPLTQTATGAMMSSERNKQLARDFFDALNRGDVPAILDAYADDGYCLTMGNTLISGQFGKAQIAQAAGRIFEVFPNGINFTIKAMTAEDDRVAVEER